MNLDIGVGKVLVPESNFVPEFLEDFSTGAWDFENKWRSHLPWRNHGLSWGGSNDGFFLINNKERQRYVDIDALPPSNTNPFSVNNLIGRITATQVQSIDQQYAQGRQTDSSPDQNLDYLSGIAISNYTHFQGRIEIEVRFPEGNGTFPAFWSFPYFPFGQWNSTPSGIQPEIDVVEYIGASRRDYNHALHSNAAGLPDIQTNSANLQSGDELGREFHKYSCDWTPEYIAFAKDGVYTAVFPTPSDLQDPAKRHILLVNLAMFGNFHDGIIAALNRLSRTPDPLVQPINMDINYIRSSAGKWTLTTNKSTHILAATRPDGGLMYVPAGRVILPSS